MLCERGDGDCNRLCTARRSDLASCDDAAGFDDRELFELALGPGHRSPLYRSSHLAARFALGLATGQEWSHFYYLNGGAEIARVEVPDWLVNDPELLALSHAMLVKQSPNARNITHKKSQTPTVHRRLAHVTASARSFPGGKPECRWRPGRQLCLSSGRL